MDAVDELRLADEQMRAKQVQAISEDEENLSWIARHREEDDA